MLWFSQYNYYPVHNAQRIYYLQIAKRKAAADDAKGTTERKKRKKVKHSKNDPPKEADKSAEVAASKVIENETAQKKGHNFLALDFEFQSEEEIPLNSSVCFDPETVERNQETLDALFGNSNSDEECHKAPSPIPHKRNLRNRKK